MSGTSDGDIDGDRKETFSRGPITSMGKLSRDQEKTSPSGSGSEEGEDSKKSVKMSKLYSSKSGSQSSEGFGEDESAGCNGQVEDDSGW